MAMTNPPLVDERGVDDFIRAFKENAPNYTPHWRFNGENRDAGSALAVLFARELAGTVERLNRTPLNHRLAFYNILGACRHPALPAFGVICLDLAAPDVEGTLVPRDFKFFSPVMDEAGTRVPFETQGEVFVTSSKVKTMLYCDALSDTLIFREGFPFDTKNEANRQRHRLTFSHPLIGKTHAGSRLFMLLDGTNAERWRAMLADSSIALWSGDVFCLETGNRVYLGNIQNTDTVTVEIHGGSALELPSPEAVSLELEADALQPDAVLAKDERRDGRFPAFGEAFSEHDTLVICCENALRQTGARVRISMNISFDEVLAGDIPPQMLPKKLVVPKHKYPETKRKDVVIEEVVWEYFNGVGFTPLPVAPSASGVFCGLNALGDVPAAGEREIEFVCPEIMPVLAGAEETLCVRARVIGIRNAYERPARILVPSVAAIKLSYRYPSPLPVTQFSLENNGTEMRRLPPVWFMRPEERHPSLSFVFDRPFGGSPVGLFVFLEDTDENRAFPHWSYYTGNGWRPLRTDDDTDGFTHSGLITLYPDETMLLKEQYGCEGYWVRAVFTETRRIAIRDIVMNGVSVFQCESTELFVSDSEVKTLRLNHENIISQDVYVNTSASEDEHWTLLDENKDYTTDRARGAIEFRETMQITAAGRTVKVRYRCGGGTLGNLPENSFFAPSLSLGYLKGAFNPIPTGGGTDPESIAATLRRIGTQYRHGGVPVTPEDYEAFIMEEDISFVKCITGSNGEVTLVILTDVPFIQVRRRALQKLEPVLPAGMCMPAICPPVFVRVCVTARLGLIQGASDKGEAEEALRLLFDPYQSAQKNGVGTLPGAEDVRRVLLALPHINACFSVWLRTFIGSEEIAEIPPMALPESGTHSLFFGELTYA